MALLHVAAESITRLGRRGEAETAKINRGRSRIGAADAALWNVALAQGTPAAPATGQAVKVALEGCAKPAVGGPPPLTQIHLQSLSPLPGGGAKVNLSSQPFDIPVCGSNGASGSTV